MSVFSAIGAILIIGLIFTLHRRRQPSYPYPPGPKGTPLVGNALDVPRDSPWFAFSRLGKEYGPLAYLNMMGQPVVVINNHKTAVNLLEKRGAIYSERYSSVMANELSG